MSHRIVEPGLIEVVSESAEDLTPQRQLGDPRRRGGEHAGPVTKPASFDWRVNIGLIGSFGARELLVGTLGVIFGIEGDGDARTPLAAKLREAKAPGGGRAYGVPTALALMAFFVIACRCMSIVAAVRRETKSWKWAGFLLAYTYAAAYLLAVLVYQGASRLLESA
jgi:ferrous iron transport protein B